MPAAAARHRLRLPALRRVQAHDRARQRRLRPAHPQAPEGRDRREGRRAAAASSASHGYQDALPVAALAAASASAWRSPARSPSSRSVLLLDEPFGALDAKVRAELRAWLRRLHDEVHVTTVLVTHDQEEAMDVADRIVVLNDGRIEQVGAPRELYERPANDFVMGFLGPGRPARRARSCARTTCASPPSRATARSRRWSTASCTSASRSASSSQLADGEPLAVAAHARRGRRARARAGRHRVGGAHGRAGAGDGGPRRMTPPEARWA